MNIKFIFKEEIVDEKIDPETLVTVKLVKGLQGEQGPKGDDGDINMNRITNLEIDSLF